MANPYVIEGLIEDPGMFFGRRVHLRRLLRHVGEMDCVSVVGPPGIGKSSLLYQLTQQEGLQETHVSLYLDLSDAALQNQRPFLREVIWGLGHQVGSIFAGSTVKRLEWVFDILRDEEKLRVLLCLDDFDQFAAAPGVTDDFLKELRRLGFARLLSLVVASACPPEELARQGVIPRTFPRLFDEQVDLGLLSAREAVRLIRDPALREGVEFPPQAVELARELGGRHALYLQLAGYHFLEQALSLCLATGEAAAEMDLQAVREQFAETAFPHLHRLWASLTAREREACRYYAGAAEARPPTVRTRQGLIQKGVVERRGGEYRLFSEHFREVVRRRRGDLEEPLPVAEEPRPLPEAQAAAPEEAAVEIVAPPEAQAAAPEEVSVEVVALPEEQAEVPQQAAVEVVAPPVKERPAPAEAGPKPSAAPPLPTVVQPEPSAGPSPQELSSLAALGCYVVAITLDLLFIVGIVVARVLFQLPARQMYILIGVAAALPVLLLFLNRLSGELWVRLFGWLLRRL